MEGIHYVINENGEKTAVQIDLKLYGDLWEDFYDSLIAHSRTSEPRETVDWSRLTAEQSLAGYNDDDSIYDQVKAADNEIIPFEQAITEIEKSRHQATNTALNDTIKRS